MKLKLAGILFTVASLVVSQVLARPITREQAHAAAQAFAARGTVLGNRLGARAEKVDAFETANGGTYFAAKMSGGGTLVLSGDDEFEPVVAILSGDEDLTTIDKAAPIWALLDRDFSARQEALTKGWASQESRLKWKRLVAARAAGGRTIAFAADPIETTAGITDLRVAPLVTARWSQSNHGENYYTPNRYVCGCVATAMSQIMHYFKWPQAEVPVFTSNCAVDGKGQQMTAKGGVYDWANMPDAGGTDEKTQEAIGRLTYDCGVSVRMQWAQSGSGAYTEDVAGALTDKFGYKNALAESRNPNTLPTSDDYLGKKVFASIDAGSPVEFGINNEQLNAGHAVVGDGYGFVDDVSYVHINMGWGGQGNAWYHLPEIDYQSTSGGTQYRASLLTTIIYNIFPEKTGWVLSGRVVDDEGEPMANARITVLREGETVATLTTSATGVWAAILPNGTYDVSATSDDGALQGEADAAILAGDNSWGNDIVLSNPAVRNLRTGETYSSLDRALLLTEAGDVLEVFGPTRLKRSVTLDHNCSIVAREDATTNVVQVLNSAAITVTNSAKLTLWNICFVGQEKPLVVVDEGAKLSLSGLVDIGSVSLAAADGLELAGEISRSIYIVTPNAKAGDVFATYSCAPGTAAACACFLLNPEDDELGGVALADGTIVWSSDAPVPDDVAVVRIASDDGSTNYRSFDSLVRHLPESGDLDITLVRDATGKEFPAITNRRVTISSEDPAASLTVGNDFLFDCGLGGELIVTNVTLSGIDGYYPTRHQTRAELVRVNGGSLALKSGATICNYYVSGDAHTNGAIYLMDGEVTLESGSSMTNCWASGKEGCGGAVRVDKGTLNLLGGRIEDCHATKFGQSVYVAETAKVCLAKDVYADEIYVYGKDFEQTPLEIVAPLEEGASVSVNHLLGLKNEFGRGALVATLADGLELDEEETTVVRRAFKNVSKFTENKDLGAEIKENTVVWGEKLPEPPMPGLVRVITGLETNEFQTVEAAFASITADSTVVLLQDLPYAEDITVSHAVTFMSDPEADGSYVLTREAGTFRVEGGSLSVTNLFWAAFSETDVGPAIIAKNGAVTLSDGATIRGNWGDGAIDASAVVLEASTFTMTEGAMILECFNGLVDEIKGDSGCGAAVYAHDGSTVNLLGGVIEYCAADHGAVLLQQSSQGFVGGDMTICNNMAYSESAWSDLIVDELSTLTVVSPLTSIIGRGYSEKKLSDPDYVAQVEDWPSWDPMALTNSAAGFFHDTNLTARVAIVTNETTTALFVWASALEDGVYVKKDKSGAVIGTYGLLAEVDPRAEEEPDDPVDPVEPDPIAFTAIVMNEDRTEVTLSFTNAVKWCNYAIYGTDSLANGFSLDGLEPVTNFQWTVESPEAVITLPTSGNTFWKATAAEGTAPTP